MRSPDSLPGSQLQFGQFMCISLIICVGDACRHVVRGWFVGVGPL